MSATAVRGPRAAARQSRLHRVQAALAAVGAAVLGGAPHVLHHAGRSPAPLSSPA